MQLHEPVTLRNDFVTLDPLHPAHAGELERASEGLEYA